MPDEAQDSRVTVPLCGLRWQTPFAFFDPDSSSWRMCQGSLLEDSGESCTTWPKQVTWDLEYVYQLETWVPPTYANASSSLLPTPDGSLFNDGQSVEAYRERKERELEKGYNGNGGGTTLAMQVRLLPTPGANDSTGAEKETRHARQEEGRTGSAALRDLPHLLPTPAARDAKGPHMEDREGGMSLGAATERLLPTPLAGDADGGRTSKGQDRPDESGLRKVAQRMLPTPMANPENPGSGGELRAALTHGPGRRNETGIDSWGRPNQGRSSGESTSPPSATGSPCSDAEPLDQLTIEDA
jgi:hypothetical protein